MLDIEGEEVHGLTVSEYVCDMQRVVTGGVEFDFGCGSVARTKKYAVACGGKNSVPSRFPLMCFPPSFLSSVASSTILV